MTNNSRGTLFLKHSQLVISWPEGREQKLSLVNDVMRIGRGNDSDLAIPMSYRSISRQHLEIRREGKQYFVIDVESSNGVFVNGERVDKAQLKDEDEIRIGLVEQGEELRFRFQLGTESLISAVTANKMDPPSQDLLSAAPNELPHLGIRWPNGNVSYFTISTDTTMVGRSPKANLSIPDGYGFVSSRHFELRCNENTFTITDLNSTNGTLLNNRRLKPDTPTDLHDNSVIRIGDDSFGISLGLTFFNPLEPAMPVEGFVMAAPSVIMELEKHIMIGRLPVNDIALDAPDVSRRHAMISKREQAYVLKDLGSRNGTFVNEQRRHAFGCEQSIQRHQRPPWKAPHFRWDQLVGAAA